MAHSASRAVKVARIAHEAIDICSFELTANDGRPMTPFSAGSHIDVTLPSGMTRQYSICNDPREQHRYLIAVLLDPASRGGSRGMHELKEGDSLRISEPKNHFSLSHEAQHSILIGGGIGITPILCMAERLFNANASFELHYCGRSNDKMAFLGRLVESGFSDRVHIHRDDGEAGQKLDVEALLTTATPAAHLYVCGPEGFMSWVLTAARTRAWPSDQLHQEHFGAAPADTSLDGDFEVLISSSGRVIKIASTKTVVECLAANGIDIPVSCEQGVCGTCLTRVLDGVPDHRDVYLTDEEHVAGEMFTPCCSRSKSERLVLDL